MSTLQHAPIAINRSARCVCPDCGDTIVDPFETILREDVPPAEPTLPLADWFECRAAYHAVQAEIEGSPIDELIASEVRCLAGVFRNEQFTSIASYLACRLPFSSENLILAKVAVPSRHFTNDLTVELDAIAATYLAMDSDPARLIAWQVLAVANVCEEEVCDTLADYFDSIAAMDMAHEAMEDEGGIDLW